jgi:hypothetical protein
MELHEGTMKKTCGQAQGQNSSFDTQLNNRVRGRILLSEALKHGFFKMAEATRCQRPQMWQKEGLARSQ